MSWVRLSNAVFVENSRDEKTSAAVKTLVSKSAEVLKARTGKTQYLLKGKAEVFTAKTNVNKKLSNRKAGGHRGMSGHLPPEIFTWPVYRNTFRFYAVGAITEAGGLISVTDVLGAMGVIGKVVNTSVVALVSSFKINKISLYVAPSSTTAVNPKLNWFSGTTDRYPDLERDDSQPPNMNTEPQCLTFTPPKDSQAGDWYNNVGASTTELVFGVEIPTTGSILDLDVSFTFDSNVAQPVTINVGVASVGSFYRLRLNKTNAVSSVYLAPTNYATTG